MVEMGIPPLIGLILLLEMSWLALELEFWEEVVFCLFKLMLPSMEYSY